LMDLLLSFLLPNLHYRDLWLWGFVNKTSHGRSQPARTPGWHIGELCLTRFDPRWPRSDLINNQRPSPCTQSPSSVLVYDNLWVSDSLHTQNKAVKNPLLLMWKDFNGLLNKLCLTNQNNSKPALGAIYRSFLKLKCMR
jgi:hypothetical protein